MCDAPPDTVPHMVFRAMNLVMMQPHLQQQQHQENLSSTSAVCHSNSYILLGVVLCR